MLAVDLAWFNCPAVGQRDCGCIIAPWGPRTQPRIVEGCAATAWRRRSRNSDPKAARQSPADNATAPIPAAASSRPNRNGAAACTVRAGAESNRCAVHSHRPEDRQGQSSFGDRDHAVAGAVQQRERDDGGSTEQNEQHSANRMQCGSEPCSRRSDERSATAQTRRCGQPLRPGRPVTQQLLPQPRTHPSPAASPADAPPSLPVRTK